MGASTRRQTGRFEDLVTGAGLMAGAANVIMQLGLPGVGHGVLESTVDSGNLFHRPWKRARTTFTYLAVSTMGSDREREAYRRAVDQQHAHVRSGESSPVEYNAFDPELQLWVAACLYKGFEDSYEALAGAPLAAVEREAVYAASAPLGTTLQVRRQMWPSSREEFEQYWQQSLEKVSIDPPVRDMLLAVADLEFLPAVLRIPFARFNRFVTTGFLPPTFREQMGLRWGERDQRRFDRLTRGVGAVALRLPAPVRRFPLNAFLADLRWRMRRGKPLV
ncbi:oxygenase MpaB family protein [Salinifilum aidingensis]